MADMMPDLLLLYDLQKFTNTLLQIILGVSKECMTSILMWKWGTSQNIQ